MDMIVSIKVMIVQAVMTLLLPLPFWFTHGQGSGSPFSPVSVLVINSLPQAPRAQKNRSRHLSATISRPILHSMRYLER